jgi:hypothetical protein
LKATVSPSVRAAFWMPTVALLSGVPIERYWYSMVPSA